MVRGDKCRPAPSIPFPSGELPVRAEQLLQILPRIAALGTGNILRRTGRRSPGRPRLPLPDRCRSGGPPLFTTSRLCSITITELPRVHQFVHTPPATDPHVFEMQPRRRLVQGYKAYRPVSRLASSARQLDTLALPARQRRTRLSQLSGSRGPPPESLRSFVWIDRESASKNSTAMVHRSCSSTSLMLFPLYFTSSVSRL